MASPGIALATVSFQDLLTKGRLVKRDINNQIDPDQLKTAKEMVGQFINDVKEKRIQPDDEHPGLVKAIQQRIAQIDGIIENQLNSLLHHPAFQRLEASWRGLHQLVDSTETSSRLKLRLMNAEQDELSSDMAKAVEPDQSGLFKKVYEEEYGTFGGSPFSCLIGDFKISRKQTDMTFLQNIAKVAAAAHTPFIAAAHPSLFDMETFEDLGVPRDLSKTFETLDLFKWREFRETEDSRYVTLVLPHVLLRMPYGNTDYTVPAEGLPAFNEKLGEYETPTGKEKPGEVAMRAEHSAFLWGNAAYTLGARITAAFARYGWTAAIRGTEGGGLVENIPTFVYKSKSGDKVLLPPTEVAITDRREKELNDQGFIALVHRKNYGQAVFFGGATTNKPKVYNTSAANANARLSAMLPYMLAASRFAHYLKAIMRDKVGSFMTRQNVQDYLNTWIANYVLLDDNASQPVKAKYPLREARVDVLDIPGKPGCYTAVAFLRPHFQLEELTVSIRLVAELPPPAAA